MKHVKLFEAYMDSEGMDDMGMGSEMMSQPFGQGFEIPEGFQIDFYRPNKSEDLMMMYKSADVENWSGMDFNSWTKTINKMGTQEYPDGKQYYRGRISWDDMGIVMNYEIHPI